MAGLRTIFAPFIVFEWYAIKNIQIEQTSLSQ
jgi:hypothetical protein